MDVFLHRAKGHARNMGLQIPVCFFSLSSSVKKNNNKKCPGVQQSWNHFHKAFLLATKMNPNGVITPTFQTNRKSICLKKNKKQSFSEIFWKFRRTNKEAISRATEQSWGPEQTEEPALRRGRSNIRVTNRGQICNLLQNIWDQLAVVPCKWKNPELFLLGAGKKKT